MVKENFSITAAIIRYLSTIQRLEKRTTENFLLLVRSSAYCVLGQRETTQGFQDQKTSPAPGTCRPPEPVPSESHVTRVSPFRDIQSSTIFKYTLNLIKTTVTLPRLYFGRKRNRERFAVGVCLDSFQTHSIGIGREFIMLGMYNYIFSRERPYTHVPVADRDIYRKNI